MLLVVAFCLDNGGYHPSSRFIGSMDWQFPAFLRPVFFSRADSVDIVLSNNGWSPYSSLLLLELYEYNKQQKKFIFRSIGDYGVVGDHVSDNPEKIKRRVRNFADWRSHYVWNNNVSCFGYSAIAYSEQGDKIALYPAARASNREFISIINSKTMISEVELPLSYAVIFGEGTNNGFDHTFDPKKISMRFISNDTNIAILTDNKILIYDVIQRVVKSEKSIKKRLRGALEFVLLESEILATYFNEESRRVECFQYHFDSMEQENAIFYFDTDVRNSDHVLTKLLPSKNYIAILELHITKNNSEEAFVRYPFCRLFVLDIKTKKSIYESVIPGICSNMVFSPDGGKVAVSGVDRNQYKYNDNIRVIDIRNGSMISLYKSNRSLGKRMFFASEDLLFISTDRRITAWDVSDK
jgi:WD40 repeat protein